MSIQAVFDTPLNTTSPENSNTQDFGTLPMPNSEYAKDSVKFWRDNTSGLPPHIKQKLFANYRATIMRAPTDTDFSKYHRYANQDLRQAVERFHRHIDKNQLWLLDGKTIEKNAKWIANCATSAVSEMLIDGYRGRKWSGKVCGYIVAKKIIEPDLKTLGLTPLFPLNKKSKVDKYQYALSRYMSDEYLQGVFDKKAAQLREYIEILFGNVREYASPYSSKKCQNEYKASKSQQKDWINEMCIQDVDDPENVVSLADAINSSVSNPTNRRNELMTRIRGLEDVAEKMGYAASFVTITAPSKYHPNSKKYNGSTPKQTQAMLNKYWAQCRSKLKRDDLPFFGLRVTEPHADSTPHWHAILFFQVEDKPYIEKVIFDYFTKEDWWELTQIEEQHRAEFLKLKKFYSKKKNKCEAANQELSAIWYKPERRVKFVDIDPAQGSAAGYVAKYVSKNIDAAYCRDKETGAQQLDDETGRPLEDSVTGVLAWASRWNIRQFQFLGGAPVTTWRECRRFSSKYDNDIQKFMAEHADMPLGVISAVAYADSGNFAKFIEDTGGAFQGRNGRVKTLLTEVLNTYEETITKVVGFRFDNYEFVTRETNWQIVQAKSVIDVLARQQSTHMGGAAAQLSSSGASRSADNNCTDQRSAQMDHPDILWRQIKERGSRLSQINQSWPPRPDKEA